jgi:hypothetical protein
VNVHSNFRKLQRAIITEAKLQADAEAEVAKKTPLEIALEFARCTCPRPLLMSKFFRVDRYARRVRRKYARRAVWKHLCHHLHGVRSRRMTMRASATR